MDDPIIHIVRVKEAFMGFSILLNLLVFKFKKAAKINENFKKFLMGHECTVVIKNKGRQTGKAIHFQKWPFFQRMLF